MKNLTCLLLAFIIGCSYANAQGNDVPYTRAKRYFVKTNYPERNLHMKKITDEDQFLGIFGMAAVMGKNGQPTIIDFSKSFVIVLIDNTNNRTEDLYVRSLKKSGDKLHVIYDLQKNTVPRGGALRRCEILVVDNAYLGTVSARMYNDTGTAMMGDDLSEDGCKPSTGYSWSILENDCIQPWTTKYILEGAAINAHENAALLFNEDMSEAEIMGSKYGPNIILSLSTTENIWTYRRAYPTETIKEKLTLIQIAKDEFIFKEEDKEIAKGKLR